MGDWLAQLKQARDNIGIKDSELARRAGANYGAVNNALRGQTRPTEQTLMKLLDVLLPPGDESKERILTDYRNSAGPGVVQLDAAFRSQLIDRLDELLTEARELSTRLSALEARAEQRLL